MAEIPRYFATQQAAVERLPRVPSREIADRGQGLEAAALVGLGQSAEIIAAKWYEREGNTQFDTQRRIAGEAVNEFEATAYGSADEHDAAYKKMRTDLKRFAPKNRSGARRYQSWLDSVSPILDRRSTERKIRGIAQRNKVAYFGNITGVAAIKDPVAAQAEARLLTQGAIDDNARTPAQAASDFEKIMDSWFTADLNRRSQTVIRLDGEVDWTATVDYLNQPKNTEGIDSDIFKSILKSMKSNAEAQKSLQKARDKENLEILQEEQLGNIYELIGTNDSEATVAIDNSAFGEEKKEDLRNLIGKNITVDWPEYDKVVGIIDGVARGTHTKEQGNQAINEGVINRFYDTTAATSLRTKLSSNSKDDSPTRTPAHTRGITEIEEIADAGIAWNKANLKSKDYGFEEESRDLHTKNRLKNELDAWALEEDRTDEEIEQKIKSLTAPVKGEIVTSWIDNWLLPFGNILRAGRLIGARRRLAGALAQPTTQAEYDALPSGTEYIDTDGTRKRKK